MSGCVVHMLCTPLAFFQGGTSTKLIIRYLGTSTFGSFGYSAPNVEFSTPPSGIWKFCLHRSKLLDSHGEFPLPPSKEFSQKKKKKGTSSCQKIGRSLVNTTTNPRSTNFYFSVNNRLNIKKPNRYHYERL